jgi:hypothetical protein
MEYIPPRRKLFNEHIVYDSSQIDEITGEFYLYYVRLTTEFLSPAFERIMIGSNQNQPEKTEAVRNECRTKCKIPKFVKDDINSGRAKLVLDYSTEGYWDIDWKWITSILEIKEDRIIWLTSLYNFADCDHGISHPYSVTIDKTSAEVRYNPLWERIVIGMIYGHVDDIEKQLRLIEESHIRKSMGILYNRRPHFHRIALLTKMKYHNELDNMIWSWGAFMEEKEIGAERYKKEMADFGPAWGELLHEKYKECYDIILRSPTHSEEDISVNKAFDMNYSHIYDTYYQVITETLYEQPGVFLSEKSYKPFLSCQPFVLCGQHHTIDVLRQQGYDVYDKWINHDYDNIEDNTERLTALTEEIIRLNSLSHVEWTKMLKEMLPDIKKNLKHLANSNNKKDVLTFDYSKEMPWPQKLIDMLA